MATLDIPLHIPLAQLRPMLHREFHFSGVTSFKIHGNILRIEHERLHAHEIIAALESLHEPLTFV